jgi:hypothetical protein
VTLFLFLLLLIHGGIRDTVGFIVRLTTLLFTVLDMLGLSIFLLCETPFSWHRTTLHRKTYACPFTIDHLLSDGAHLSAIFHLAGTVVAFSGGAWAQFVVGDCSVALEQSHAV